MNKLILCVFSLIVINTFAKAQAPNISYSGPQKYTYGSDITPISPTNTGGAVPANVYGKLSILAGPGAKTQAGSSTVAALPFNTAYGIAADKNGNIFVADTRNNIIRKITQAGVVSTFAGNGGESFADGTGTAAGFYGPTGLVFDNLGNLIVTDRYNNRIRKITPTGVVTTLAGNANTAYVDGSGVNASFDSPCGIAIDGSGNFFIADQGNNRIRRMAPDGAVTTFAGGGNEGLVDGVGAEASFYLPMGIVCDQSGNLYVADNVNNAIRKITAAGVVTTLAGSGKVGSADGISNNASFYSPISITVDPAGNLYVADQYNQLIRKISPEGDVTTLPITESAGLFYPAALIYNDGKLYFSNTGDNTIRTVNLSGYSIDKALPAGLVFDNSSGRISGNPTTPTPTAKYTVTAINESGISMANLDIAVVIPAIPPSVTSILPSASIAGNTVTITGTNFLGATSVTIGGQNITQFTILSGTKIAAVVPPGAAAGNVSVTNTYGTSSVGGFSILNAPNISYSTPQTLTVGNAVTPITVTNTGGVVPNSLYGNTVAIAGSGASGSQNGTGAAASFNAPRGIVADGLGNLYVSDNGNNVIRKISAGGVVTNYTGSDNYNGSGFVNGSLAQARFSSPSSLTIDQAKNLYVLDVGNSCIRKIDVAGNVTTYASINFYPGEIAVDKDGNIFVPDRNTYQIRKITPTGGNTVFAGAGYGVSSVDGSGLNASFYNPYGITIDKAGNLFVSDVSSRSIRKITPAGVVTTILTFTADELVSPGTLTIDQSGNLIIANQYNYGAILVTPEGVKRKLNFDQDVNAAGLTVDDAGDLYLTNFNVNKIIKQSLTGYAITPALPKGLSLSNTGIISGAPEVVTPLTDYKITATNIVGSSTAVLKLSTQIPALPPTISSTSASETSFGKKIIINGTNLLGATSVKIGAAELKYSALSPGAIAALVTATATGDLTVTNPYGTATFKGLVVAPPPVISYTSPQTFTVDEPITGVAPSNSGSAIPNIQLGKTTTLAGSRSVPGGVDGAGTAAGFTGLLNGTVDAWGNIFVSDYHSIRKITPQGVVTTYAGSTFTQGSQDGTAKKATFNNPMGLATDLAGNLYVADYYNSKIRKINPDGIVSTYAVTNDLPNFQTVYPTCVAVNSKGEVFYGAQNVIKKISAEGVISTFAGGSSGTADANTGFISVNDIAFDAADNLYVADINMHKISKITPAGAVTRLAGSGVADSFDGKGASATFRSPSGIDVDSYGNVFVADRGNNLIRMILPDGTVKTLAGNSFTKSGDGVGIDAGFYVPTDVIADNNGSVIVLDAANSQIRKVAATGYWMSPSVAFGFDGASGTISGTPNGVIKRHDYVVYGINAFGNSQATISLEAKLPAVKPNITSINPASAAANQVITIIGTHFTGASAVQIGGKPAVDFNVVSSTQIIAKVNSGATGSQVSVTNSTGEAVFSGFSFVQPPTISYGIGQVYKTGVAITPLTVTKSGSNISDNLFAQATTLTAAAAAQYYGYTGGVVADAAGNVYVLDRSYYRINKITPAGVVSVFAGSGSYATTDGMGTAASFSDPMAIAIDGAGNLYVSESSNYIRKITPGGVVTTIAGVATKQNGLIDNLVLDNPRCLAVDAFNNLYVADAGHYRILKMTSSGRGITTIAGDGTFGTINGPSHNARLGQVIGIAVDGIGNIYISENSNVIRKMGLDSVITTFAGTGGSGSENGTGTSASFNNPSGLTTDLNGNVYVADYFNRLIRKITPAGVVSTLAGSGANALTDAIGTGAGFKSPNAVFADAAGTLFVSDNDNRSVRKVAIAGYQSVNPLPDGLTLQANGTISGTPLSPSPATDYTIAAYSFSGQSTTTVNIKVQPADAPPSIVSFSPVTAKAGSTVVITGNNFVSTSVVKIGGVVADNFTVLSPTSIVVVVGSNGLSGDISVTNAFGTASLAGFSILSKPKFSYPDNLAFENNVAITPVTPTQTGSAIPAYNYQQVSTFAGLNYNDPNLSYGSPSGLTVDANGNIYIVDTDNQRIKKLTPAGTGSSVAGNGNYGFTNGLGNAAAFGSPTDIVTDALGNMFILDGGNNAIRKMTPTGLVSTFAGSGARATLDGTGTAAAFDMPVGLTIDLAGNLYVSELSKHIRKITPAGVVTTLAGTIRERGPAEPATLSPPNGMATDHAGNLFIGDGTIIKKITPEGVVTTYAGTGAVGHANGNADVATFTNASKMVIDADDNLYVAEEFGIRKITKSGIVTTVAGSGDFGSVDGAGTAAKFTYIKGMALDADGNLLVTDRNLIRKIALTGYVLDKPLPEGLAFDNSTGVLTGSPSKLVSNTPLVYNVTGTNAVGSYTARLSFTIKAPPLPVVSYNQAQTYTTGVKIAPLSPSSTGGTVPALGYGNTTTFAGSGSYGNDNATGTAATFAYPAGLMFDYDGNLIVTQQARPSLRKITPAGVVTTFAGVGEYGSNDGALVAASFSEPISSAKDSKGNIYVADTDNGIIRKISGGQVTTIAGTPGTKGFVNGTGSQARFNGPYGIAVDAADNIYVSDRENHVIRKTTQGGVVTTFAGTGQAGFVNGTGTSASFNSPDMITAGTDGNLYLADTRNHAIRKITPAGVVTTVAGTGTAGFTNGTAASATFNLPTCVTQDAQGNLYVADFGNNAIRKIDKTGNVTTVAGNGKAQAIDGAGLYAGINQPMGVIITNDGSALYVSDYGGNKIRKIDLLGYAIDKVLPEGLVFNGATGVISGIPTKASPETAYTITATNTAGVASAIVKITVNGVSAPNISYAAETHFKVNTAASPLTPVNTGGAVPQVAYGSTSVFAGSLAAGSTDGDKNSINTTFNNPSSLVFDKTGNLYITDQSNNKIRKISTDGVVSTFAGSGSAAYADGQGNAAAFYGPTGIAVDGTGYFYVADRVNSKIRLISPTGVVTTFNGISMSPPSPNVASLYLTQPYGLVSDEVVNKALFVSDQGSSVIRKISNAGIISIYAGYGGTGYVNGPAANAKFNMPTGMAVDAAGNLYVADQGNHAIRKITTDGTVSTYAGTGQAGFVNGSLTAATFNLPTGLAFDKFGNLYVADRGNNAIRKITPSGTVSTLLQNPFTERFFYQTIESPFIQPIGLAIDPSGTLYVVEAGRNIIRNISTYGYDIDKALPQGLAFDKATGVISGVPTVATPVSDYVITAYNYGGSSSTTIKVGVDPEAAPSISYTGPQQYAVNIAIKALLPNNTAGIIPDAVYKNVITVAGNGLSGNVDGIGNVARFDGPVSVVSDKEGNIYVADVNSNKIRKITPNGDVTTITSLNGDYGNNTSINAVFNYPSGITLDASGNLFVAEKYNHVIKKITPAGVATTFAGNGNAISLDGKKNNASFLYPSGITIDALGNLFVLEVETLKVRKITPEGVVTTIVGSGLVNGTIKDAGIGQQPGIAVDKSGNLYVTNQFEIKKITPAGVISTLAGNNGTGHTDGQGTAATFGTPTGIAIDANDNIFISEYAYIRKVTPDGTVTTIAGHSDYGNKDGLSADAGFYGPNGLCLDMNGNIIITDTHNNLIRKIYKTGYSITPLLPDGLQMDEATGAITGTPTKVTAAADYTVTGTNAGGKSITKVNIAVITQQTPVITFTPVGPLVYGSADIALTATSTNTTTPVVYASDNTNVATIVNGKLHVVATGTFNLTASQASGAANVPNAEVKQQITVSPMAIAIKAAAVFKTYGDADPALTYTITAGSLIGADVLSGKPARAEGNDVGTYAISQGTLAINGNYQITFVPANFTITAKAITVIAAAKSKIYGDADPALTYTVATGALVGTDAVTGTLTRAEGTGVGTYVINQGSVTVNKNYQITYVPARLTITPKAVTVTAAAKSKVYGDTDPALTYTVTSGTLVGTDVFTGALLRAAGENVATYAINQGSLTLSANYLLSYVPASLTIMAKAVAVSADNITKVYGSADPAFTYKLTTGSLIGTDSFTGSLNRVAGDNAGDYTINQGTLALSGNYLLSYNTGKLTVTPKSLTVTAQDQTRAYGEANKPLTFNYSGFANSDDETSLTSLPVITTIANQQSAAGNYDITIAGGTAGNYSFVYKAGKLSVLKATLTVTANDVYRVFGKDNPAFTVAYSGFVNGDTQSSLTALPVVNTVANSTTAAGVYDLIVGGASSANYTFDYVKGKINITVPVTNMKVAAVSATCKNQTDGSINLTAVQNLNYTATMAGKTYNFTDKLSITGLGAGSYTVCVTAAGLPGYNQCFTVAVTEPADLSVYSVVNKQVNTVSLSLAGSDSYTIVLNGKTYQTKNSSITLPLNGRVNKLTVNGEKLCQGVIEREIVGADNMVPYPNPFQNVVYLNLGETVQANCTVKIVNLTDGKAKLVQKFTNQSGIIQFDVSALNLGVYALQLTLDNNKEVVYKIIKK